MREFLRGCLVWLLGFPLSVVVATAIVTAPVWLFEPSPLSAGVRVVANAAPVVAFFSFAPAVLTPRSPDLRAYVLAGARTGAWCGALALSMFIIVGVAAALGALAAVIPGRQTPESSLMLLSFIGWIAGGIAVFAAAGAAGGFVFGLVAARERA